ncbi:UNVERIFIED_CONTAM: hypothetical protein Sradi_3289700 [Sesamum radiatum]|uniref:Reverse transcriptase domain-containing protein n=1 Tax=Sesamum radiatum TaxID=300843 RepID=A0AAW2R0N9_SESRA
MSFFFMFNGKPFGYLQRSKGPPPGDPLSLYLFLFSAEALCGLVRQAKEEGSIRGGVLHWTLCVPLAFCDGTLLFYNATGKTLLSIRGLLTRFEHGSRLQVNYQKSAIVFSRNVSLPVQEELVALLGVVRVEKHEKYLGLPSIIGKSKMEVFEGLKDRV